MASVKAQKLWTKILGGGSLALGVAVAVFGVSLYDRRRHCLPVIDSQKSGNSQIFNQKESAILIEKARSIIKTFKEECGSPGLSITVCVNGKNVWSEGFGYSDVENGVNFTPNTVMRIASISKPLTATAVMQLMEDGKISLDEPVQNYVPNFPEKKFNFKPCIITIRHLLSHKSGIRHYHFSHKSETLQEQKKKDRMSEFDKKEYYIKEYYGSVEKSLTLFKDDPLLHEPGTEFLYTTYGWTLLSAVVESAANMKFLPYMRTLFDSLDMNDTGAELHLNLVYGRARHYMRNEKGQLINTPYVDNSYKWAGGGFISTTEDLVKFGNAMLYASQVDDYEEKYNKKLLPGILSSKNVALSWTMVENTFNKTSKGWGYGLGWGIKPVKRKYGCLKSQKKIIAHTGGAIGGSSILLICPNSWNDELQTNDTLPPNGVVVAILVNMERVSLSKVAMNVAQIFNT